MITILNLLAAGVLGAWAVRCAGRLIDGMRRKRADALIDDDGLTRLADAIRAEPAPADRTPVGDDDWTRHMRRSWRRTARRRNTGPRPRKEEQ